MQNFLNYLNPFSFYAQSMSHGSQKLKLFLLWLYINILYLGDNLQMEYTKCLLQAFNIQTEKVKTLRKNINVERIQGPISKEIGESRKGLCGI